METKLIRGLYSLCLYTLVPFTLVYLLWRSRSAPAYRKRWGERFGYYPASRAPKDGIWIHAVSVGETLAAVPLVRAIKISYPQIPIVFTTTTPTGSERVKQSLGDLVYHLYIPYDLPGAVHRFLRRFRPSLVLIMETEIWPNMFYQMSLRNIPLVVANARLSPNSFKNYQRFSHIVNRTLQAVTVFGAQSNDDALRFISLGAEKKRVRVTGNLKFDLMVPEGTAEKSAALRRELGEDRTVLVAASTHDNEEEQILQCYRELKAQHEELLLLLVPRHPERFDEVAALCEQMEFSVVRRSRGESCDAATDVYLGDTMGELLIMYGACDIAFVGGSLIPHGGQNPLEPAALGKPIIFGEHTFNFKQITELLVTTHAGKRVHSRKELTEVLKGLLEEKDRRITMGEQAKMVVETNKGALKNLLFIITPVLRNINQDLSAS